MKFAVIGPVCRDKPDHRPGGFTYYFGNAAHSLGAHVIVYGSFGEEDDFSDSFKCGLRHIPAEGTVIFENTDNTTNPDKRLQRAWVYDNTIPPEHIPDDLSGYDVALGPLYHDNISPQLIEKIHERLHGRGETALAIQGMLRHLDRDNYVVLREPENLRFLQYTDYLFLNEKEMSAINPYSDIRDGARYLKDCGAKNVLVTRGSNGSRLFLDNGDYEIGAFPPEEEKDRAGLGDSFAAGLLVARKRPELSGDPVKQGEFAAMVATICMENQGPFNKDRDYVFERLRKHGIQF